MWLQGAALVSLGRGTILCPGGLGGSVVLTALVGRMPESVSLHVNLKGKENLKPAGMCTLPHQIRALPLALHSCGPFAQVAALGAGAAGC